MMSTLAAMLRRLMKPGSRTHSARSVEYFGWLDLGLGCVILIAPSLAAWLLRIGALTAHDTSILRMVGVLVAALGMLYVVSGRLNSEGFVVASLLDRPLVPAIMTVLWSRGILPGSIAIAFSVSDFGGFLHTALAWRADLLRGDNIGGPALRGQSRFLELFRVAGRRLVRRQALAMPRTEYPRALTQSIAREIHAALVRR